MSDLPSAMKASAFLYGWRMDTMAFGILLVPPMLALTLAPAASREVVRRLVHGWTLLVLLVLGFLESATFSFFAEYDVRPNILLLDYLRYPKEVASMLWKSQKLSLGISVVILITLVMVFKRLTRRSRLGQTLGLQWRWRAVWLMPWLIVLGLCIRSSFGHRPANISDALYSTNRVANEIAKNSLYSVGDALFRSVAKGKGQANSYGRIDREKAYARAFKLFGTPSDAKSPFLREIPTSLPSDAPRNLVIIIEESLGAQFAGFTGGEKGLTPHLDDLADRGIAFTNLYANGTRSIQGLSAMSAGFLPIVGDGVIKRPKSQTGFFSLASLLKPHGYRSSFIYGGEARFDNMKSWYLGNGFDDVIEEKDYAKPTFVSSWGVSDEDLFIKANDYYKGLAGQGNPFVSVIFTSSNHEPFELPEGKIQWVTDTPKRSVKNAIKYADFAIGRFFELAKSEAYFRNTVFVVVADHNVRSVGDDVVPIESFRIPAVIFGKGITPRRYARLCSQQDVLATSLDLLGLRLKYPILGNSVLKSGPPAFAFMKFNDSYALRRGDKVAVFRLGKAPATFLFNGGRLHPTTSDPDLESDGLALLHVTEDLYDRRLYR